MKVELSKNVRLDDTKPWRWIWLAMAVFSAVVLVWWFREMMG